MDYLLDNFDNNIHYRPMKPMNSDFTITNTDKQFLDKRYFKSSDKNRDGYSLDIISNPRLSLRFKYFFEAVGTDIIYSRNPGYKYPLIRFETPKNETFEAYYLMITLHETSLLFTKNDINEYDLSPHFLMKKQYEKLSKEEKYRVGCAPIIVDLIPTEQDPHVYEFELKDYYIMRVKPEEVSGVLQEKLEQYELTLTKPPLHNKNEKITKDLTVPIIHTSERATLSFNVYKKTNDRAHLRDRNYHYKHIIGPVHATNFLHRDDVVVKKLCNTHGSVNGGDEITMYVSHVTKDYTKVRLFRISKEGKLLWECFTEITEVYRKKAISFVLPKYPRDLQIERMRTTHCYIQLVSTTGIVSNMVRFFYVNDADEPKSQEFDTPVFEKSDEKSQNSSKTDEFSLEVAVEALYKYIANSKSSELFQKVEKLNRAFMQKHPHGNSIFHDALKCDQYIELHKLAARYRFKSLLINVKNMRQETLLHYACKLNKADCIHLIIKLGCTLYAQDIKGRTPLHFAIMEKHHEVLAKFEEVLVPKNKRFSNARQELKQLFHTYNRRGYTIVHLAVLQDLQDFVSRLLQFTKQKTYDLSRIPVLTNGDTICHLAHRNKLNNMREVIRNYIDCDSNHENYQGKTLADIIPNNAVL